MPRTSEVLPRAEEIWNLNDEAPTKAGDKTPDRTAEKAAARPSDKSAKAESSRAESNKAAPIGERGDDDRSPSIAPKT
ncbi:hypothetical protein [Bradyrhizobium sp. 2TAF24]|uniref:hypothetical protein n=1 Tax=Bradyrhizobium sp. 2TAF24 TaxID=3233011 RepID=UPI003F92F344